MKCLTLDRIKSVVAAFTSGGAAQSFFSVFQGRCTFAAICFSVAGVYGWEHGRDLTSFALFVTAVQGLLVLHSWKEDVAEQSGICRERAIQAEQRIGKPSGVNSLGDALTALPQEKK